MHYNAIFVGAASLMIAIASATPIPQETGSPTICFDDFDCILVMLSPGSGNKRLVNNMTDWFQMCP